MKRLLLATFVALVSTASYAQGPPQPVEAELEVPPTSEAHRIIDAKLAGDKLPDGSYIDGGWEVEGPQPDMRIIGFTDMFFTGTPGKYVVVYDGVLLRDRTFKDGDGNSITIREYLGRIKKSAPCEIIGVGPPPDPDPDPDPTPTGKFDVMVFYAKPQLLDMTKEQNAVINSMKLREDMAKAGHTFLRVYEDDVFTEGIDVRHKDFAEAIKDKDLPVVVVRDKETGQVFWKPLPKSPAEMLSLLEDWK